MIKLSEFLNDIKATEEEVVAYCVEHILAKKCNIDEDSMDEETLKEMFVDYNMFNKSLADSIGVIYKKYEAEMDDVYEAICSKFNVESDNKSVFDYRLARVANQEAKQFIDIEDEDTQETVIQKFEDKNIVGAGFIINLPDLNGDKKLIEKGIEIHSLMEF